MSHRQRCRTGFLRVRSMVGGGAFLGVVLILTVAGSVSALVGDAEERPTLQQEEGDPTPAGPPGASEESVPTTTSSTTIPAQPTPIPPVGEPAPPPATQPATPEDPEDVDEPAPTKPGRGAPPAGEDEIVPSPGAQPGEDRPPGASRPNVPSPVLLPERAEGDDQAFPAPPDGELPGQDELAPPPSSAGAFPAELQALTDSIVRSGPSSSAPLIEALGPLGELGMSPEEAALVGFGRFPVAGLASYTHDWWFPRFGPGWRLHQGTDIFAAMGTPVRSPVDGTVRVRVGGLGGVTVSVVQPDGTYYYLAHLLRTADGLVDGQPVTTGEVVGSVGTSGNAQGTPSHLHIEIHPRGGEAIDPKPVLDGFLVDALAGVPALLEASTGAGRGPAVETPVPPPPRLAGSGPGVPGPNGDLAGLAMWSASMSPSGGALGIALSEVDRTSQVLGQRQQRALSRAAVALPDLDPVLARVELLSVAWLERLVPGDLGRALGWPSTLPLPLRPQSR